jgi:hypothetical protein
MISHIVQRKKKTKCLIKKKEEIEEERKRNQLTPRLDDGIVRSLNNTKRKEG